MNKIAIALLLLGTIGLAFVGHRLMNKKTLSQVPGGVVEAFNAWKLTHKKTYKSPAETNFRMITFMKNYFNVQKWNAEKKFTFKTGLNFMSDLTEEEMLAKYTGLKIPKDVNAKLNKKGKKTLTQTAGDVDWRNQGAVNAIKNQGNCGSCWAFSATAAIEGAWKIGGNQLLNLAEQQMVDCGGSTGNYGCNGGWMDWAFQYIINAGGQNLSADYPYQATDNPCRAIPSKFAARISSFTDVPQNNCAVLQSTITRAPVSVAIAAVGPFFSYTSGIFNYAQCGTGLNHGVTAIGYHLGDTTGNNYYIVRNSWGSTWGQGGYIWMSSDVQTGSGICGICMVSSTPNL